MIDARDDDLSRRELEKLRPGARAVGSHQTGRNKLDLHCGPLGSARHRIIVAHRTPPSIEDTNAFKGFTPQRHRASPGEVAMMVAEHADDGGIPGGAKQRWKMETVGNVPAIARAHRSFAGQQRCSQIAQPMPGEPGVRITEDVNAGVTTHILHGVAQVMNLLTAVRGGTGHQNVRNTYGFQLGERFVGYRLDDEINVERGEILIENRPDVFLELWINALTRTKD